MTEQCEIVVEPQPGLIWRRWQFAAVDPKGTRIAESPPFQSGMFSLLHGAPEHRILEELIYQLQLDGWQVGFHGSEWYRLRLFRTDARPTPRVPPGPAGMGGPSFQRSGLSTQAMWGISLAVLVALFFVCVVLVLSAELRLTPG